MTFTGRQFTLANKVLYNICMSAEIKLADDDN